MEVVTLGSGTKAKAKVFNHILHMQPLRLVRFLKHKYIDLLIEIVTQIWNLCIWHERLTLQWRNCSMMSKSRDNWNLYFSKLKVVIDSDNALLRNALFRKIILKTASTFASVLINVLYTCDWAALTLAKLNNVGNALFWTSMPMWRQNEHQKSFPLLAFRDSS